MGEMALQQFLRDRRELISRLDKVHYFTRGSKVGLRQIGPETAKISRNIHPNKARGTRVLVELIVTAAEIYQRTMSPASLSRPARRCPARPYTCARCAYVCIVYIQCVVIAALSCSTPRCVRYL